MIAKIVKIKKHIILDLFLIICYHTPVVLCQCFSLFLGGIMAKFRGWGKGFLQKQKLVLETKLNECLEQQTRVRGYFVNIERDGFNDSADKASAVLEQELRLRQANGCAEQIFKVSHAILAIKARTYGTCDNCREHISKKRLKAIPWANFCTECQDKQEKIKSLRS